MVGSMLGADRERVAAAVRPAATWIRTGDPSSPAAATAVCATLLSPGWRPSPGTSNILAGWQGWLTGRRFTRYNSTVVHFYIFVTPGYRWSEQGRKSGGQDPAVFRSAGYGYY